MHRLLSAVRLLGVVSSLFLAAGVMSGDSACADETSRPNIVVIVADDLGWMDIGYHGSEIKTPHLDKLARTGVRLESHYVFTTCSPTRAALLAGRYPSRYGILGPIGGRSTLALPQTAMTLPRLLKSAGYHTAISGKWHLGLRPEVGPRQYGFDSTYGYLHGQLDQLTHVYKNGDRTWHRQDEFIDEEGHATDLITDEAVRLIKATDKQPLFLYVPYSVPHYPLQESAEWTGPYENEIADRDRRLYAASVTHMDAGVGRIVAALEEAGKRENTIILFTSDNGGQESYSSKTDYGGQHSPNKVLGNNQPLRGWKGDLYEGGIRVPAFINWPGKLTPGAASAPLSVTDWLPTFAALTGVKVSEEWQLDGRNVWPALKGDEDAARELQQRTLYWKTPGESAVRSGDWKLIVANRGQRPPQLFHLADDPYEKTNLAESQADRVKQLQSELERQRERDR